MKIWGECPEGLTLERISVNGNYCKENCEWATYGQQLFNQRKRIVNKSGVVGVNKRKDTGKWEARICFQGKTKILYYGNDFEEAVKVRLEAEIKYYGFNPNRGEQND